MHDVIYAKPDKVSSFHQQINETFSSHSYFGTVKSKVIFSLFETMRLSISIMLVFRSALKLVNYFLWPLFRSALVSNFNP